MVQNYVRKTNWQAWSAQSMEEAVASVLRGDMSLKKASHQFKVPKTALQRAVKTKQQDETFTIDKSRGKIQNVFSPEQELELVQYFQDMEARLFGLTLTDGRALAFQLAENNKSKHPFNRNNQMAGEGRMNKFLSRHPQLSLRKPEATSGARAGQWDLTAQLLLNFLNLLCEIVDKHKLTAERIYNCDETGITFNPKGHSKNITHYFKRKTPGWSFDTCREK
jgi:hypothetical protein